MKVKEGFILRKLGKEYMVVAVGEASKTFNGMIRMNATGAWYWEELTKGITRDELVQKMLERYENLDAETAAADLDEFLDIVKDAIND